MINIALLTEAGEKVGYGHISRIRAIAYYLRRFGFDAQIFISPQDSFEILEDEILLDWKLSFVEGFDFVIIDSYLASLDIYKNYAKKYPALFFDDDLRIKYPKGMILNGAIGVENIYKKDKKCRYLLGEKYLLLRPEFSQTKETHLENIRKILITLGANDIRNLSPKIVATIKRYNEDFEITQIITDAYRYKDSSVKYLKNLNAEDMAKAMLEADIAFSAGGQSLLELCAIGIPTLSITVANNQKNNIAYLSKIGLTRFLGNFDEVNLEENIFKNLKELEDKKTREDISKSLQKKFSFCGGENIVKEIKSYFLDSKLKKNLLIKKVKLTNFINLSEYEKVEVLNWRNDKKISANMMDDKEISLESHLRFIETLKSRSDKHYFKVGDFGVVTIEEIELENGVCGFGIYKNPRQEKVGDLLICVAIQIIFKKLNVDKIRIKVKKQNEVAQNLYIKHDFVTAREDGNLLILELKKK